MSMTEYGARTTRRSFMRAAGALGAGLYVGGISGSRAAAAPAKLETLALNGGPKAVTSSVGGAT